ncbi:MAG: hypothetical protein IJ874_04050 [Ruminococcus sp.]|nr:hypothetical protein [Ruminococcus sp.]
MKKLLFSIILLLPLTGCSSDGLVHDKAYLRAAAVDGNTYVMSFFAGEDIVTAQADSPEAAVSAAEELIGREIFTGFTELIILDDCPDGAEVLADMLKKWRVSPSCIAVSGDSGLLYDTDPEVLEGQVRQAQRHGTAPECGIVYVLSQLLDEKNSALLPELKGG